MSNQRKHYRIQYPIGERPKLQMRGESYEILDVSEKGICFDAGPRYAPTDGDEIKGKIVFKNGKTCDVEGKLLRFDRKQHACVVKLVKGISLAKIMEEQRLLLQKYNTL